MMYVALTYDHRLIDGREAVTFLRKIKSVVEDPRVLLLDMWNPNRPLYTNLNITLITFVIVLFNFLVDQYNQLTAWHILSCSLAVTTGLLLLWKRLGFSVVLTSTYDKNVIFYIQQIFSSIARWVYRSTTWWFHYFGWEKNEQHIEQKHYLKCLKQRNPLNLSCFTEIHMNAVYELFKKINFKQ